MTIQNARFTFLTDEQKLDGNTDKIELNSDTLETLNQNIDHTEEVIIGTEHGMTFPTQIGPQYVMP